jgi:hypothetical protein
MKRQHYHLFCGSVMFRDPAAEGENAVGEIKLNTTTRTDSKDVPIKTMGKAQQALQMLMFQKLEDPNLVVIDVVFTSIFYCGYMTEKEFMLPPEGTEMRPIGTQIDPALN